MQHAAPRETRALRRVAVPVSVAGLLVASTFALSAGSAGAVEGGGNENCADGQTEIKFDSNELKGTPMKSEGVFSASLSDIRTGDTSESSASPTVTMGSDVRSFDFEASAGLVSVIVKGGTEVKRVTGTQNADGTFSGDDITAAINDNNGKPFGVSNVKFCFGVVVTSTASPSASATPAATASPSPTATPSASATPTATATASPTATASTSATASPTATASTSATASPTPTETESPAPTTPDTAVAGGGGGPVVVNNPVLPVVGGGGGPVVVQAPTAPGGPEPTETTVIEAAPISDVDEQAATRDDTARPSALPFTGYDTDTFVMIGWLALAAGVLMAMIGRRRTALR